MNQPPPQEQRPSPFEHSDYKSFLAAMQEHGRGETKRMAEAAGCQRSYLSQVIHGKVQLTPDHGFKLAKHFQFSSVEREYFLTQLEYARASSPDYQEFLAERLIQMKGEHQNTSVQTSQEAITDAGLDQTQYFSAWYWCAIHLLTRLSEFQHVSAIAKRLHLPEKLVLSTLESLMAHGFVRQEGNRWKYLRHSTRLPIHSPLSTLHHNNWRAQAVLRAQLQDKENLHFTHVRTMSRSVMQELRVKILKLMEESERLASSSPEEELISITLDCFRI